MQEIKFQAWHKKNRVMIPWGLLQLMMDGKSIRIPKNGDDFQVKRTSAGIQFPPMQEVVAMSDIKPGNPFKNPDFLMLQFSGFKDNFGTEIYQGNVIDVLQYNPSQYAIDFIAGAFCATHPNLPGYPIDLNHFNGDNGILSRVKVVGFFEDIQPFAHAWSSRLS